MRWFHALRHSSHLHALFMQGVSAVFGMLTFLALARWMGPEGAGVIVIFLTAATMVDMLRSGFFQPALVRMLQSDKEELRATLRGTTLGFGGMLSLIFGGILALGSVSGLLALITTHSELFGVVWGLMFISTYPGQAFTWFAQAESRFDRMVVYRAVTGVLMLSGIVFLKLMNSLDPVSVGWVFVTAGAGSSLFVTLMGWLPWGELKSMSREAAGRIARFGRYSMTTTLGTALLRSSDTFLIGAFAGPAPVALFGVAQKAAEVLDLPLRALSASLYPVLSVPGNRGEGRRVGRIIERAVSGYWLALVIPAAVLFVLAEPLVILAAGDAYVGAVPAMRLFIVASFLLPFDRMIGLGLDSLGRPEVNMGKVIFMLSANVVGDILVLVCGGSIAGVAFVTIMMNGLGLFAGWCILQPTVNLSIGRMWRLLSYWLKPSYVRLQLERSKGGAGLHG